MALDLFKKTRWLSLASLLALACGGAVGCSADQAEDGAVVGDEVGSSTDDITQVNHSKVKRQSIGNCWLYAVTSWLEALNKEATGSEVNTSESWLTYWHWFDQLSNGHWGDEISTGGSYGTGVELITRYGLMKEGDFIPDEADDEMSNTQKTALDAINASLKSGVLSDPEKRRDRAIVREELDKAWNLSPEMRQKLDTVFGASVNKTIDRSYATREPGNGVIRAKDFPAKLMDPETRQKVTVKLSDAIGTSSEFWGPREGKFAWNEETYPTDATGRREFWKRVQKALHDNMPVVTSWKVDFNALTRDSHFSLEELETRGPGRQGGHMTVMHDYEAEVPGIGLLKAGEQATKEQMTKALSDDTKIIFVRVKNSWGGIRPDRWDDAVIPGYHDLDMAYLNGPIKECTEDDHGNTDPNDCPRSVTPLWDVVLPAGY
jgi:hypothetical protein